MLRHSVTVVMAPSMNTVRNSPHRMFATDRSSVVTFWSVTNRYTVALTLTTSPVAVRIAPGAMFMVMS